MKLKTKAWLVSQSLLIITAIIIQLTFYREIKVGPMLGMAKRSYWDIIQNVEPEIPNYVVQNNLLPEMYDARLPLSQEPLILLIWVPIEKPIVRSLDLEWLLRAGL